MDGQSKVIKVHYFKHRGNSDVPDRDSFCWILGVLVIRVADHLVLTFPDVTKDDSDLQSSSNSLICGYIYPIWIHSRILLSILGEQRKAVIEEPSCVRGKF